MNHEKYHRFYRFVSVWNDILAFLVTIAATLFFIAGGLLEIFLVFPVGDGYLVFILVWIAGILLLIGSIAVFLYAGAILWDPTDEEPKKYLFFEILSFLMIGVLIIFLIVVDIMVSFIFLINLVMILFPITGMILDGIAFSMKRRRSEMLEKRAVREKRRKQHIEEFPEEEFEEAKIEPLQDKKYGVQGLAGEYAGVEIEFQPGENIVFGKSPEQSQVVFKDPKVSRFHLYICYHKETDDYHLTDYSMNGTYTADGERLIKEVAISFHSGEIIQFGKTQIFQFL